MNFTKEDIDNLGFEIIEKVFKEQLVSLGYSIREPQIEMAEEILDMIKNRNKSFIVEAGVGTGKSFAYLIPLLILQKRDRIGFSVIISTGTISLQEQLVKDINYLKEILKIETNVVLAKGKTHFLCLDRLFKYYNGQHMPEWIKEWSSSSPYGDQAELTVTFPEINNHWEQINVKHCKFRNCPYFSDCGYIQLRNSMRESDSIIVTNHDQLIANARNINTYKRRLFPEDTDIIVVDEAHNLEEKARNALTETWSKNKVNSVLNAADNSLKRSDNYENTKKRKNNIIKQLNQLFVTIEKHCKNVTEINDSKGHDTLRFSLPLINDKFLDNFVEDLNSYNTSLQLLDAFYDDFDDITENLEDLIEFMKRISKDDKIYWVEKTGHKNFSINSVDKEVNEIIHEYFFSYGNVPVILTSATISQPGEDNFERYDYLISSLGLDFLTFKELALSEPKLSPFNYDENSLLYIPTDMPSPTNKDDYIEQSIEIIYKLLNATEGRTMILFTSKKDMEVVYSKLKELDIPWNIILQKDGSSQNAVKKEFTEDEHSILLSTGTFWEGIDIPGSSLSSLVIFRLPFPVPDPILEYKTSISEDGFNDIYLPEMLIKLRQGLGRLIRKESDKGIATLLDSRLSTKSNKTYRKTVLQSLPFQHITEDYDEVNTFIKEKLEL
jgi:ATP-dependent DNA helicase DinG